MARREFVVAAAILLDSRNRVLLVGNDWQGYGNVRYTLPGGVVERGESTLDALSREVKEETGIECEVIRPIAILDGQRRGFTRIPLISIVFLCEMTGGDLKPHPLECSDVGFFGPDNLPEPTASRDLWAEHAFAAINGEDVEILFDLPRRTPWRGGDT